MVQRSVTSEEGGYPETSAGWQCPQQASQDNPGQVPDKLDNQSGPMEVRLLEDGQTHLRGSVGWAEEGNSGYLSCGRMPEKINLWIDSGLGFEGTIHHTRKEGQQGRRRLSTLSSQSGSREKRMLEFTRFLKFDSMGPQPVGVCCPPLVT